MPAALSYWEATSYYQPVDVIIIGAGVVGLWTAYHLKKKYPHQSILVVDKGSIPQGASTRNAGFACFGSVSELLSDVEQFGEEAMLHLVEQRFKGLRQIQSLFPANKIGYEPCGGFEIFRPEDEVVAEKCKDALPYLNRLIKPITSQTHNFKLSTATANSLGFPSLHSLIENPLEGVLHSGLLVQSLEQLVREMGVHLRYGVAIEAPIQLHEKVELPQINGPSFYCKFAITCINGFAKQLLPQLDVQPARGQVVVTSPIKELSFKGSFHYEEGFYYFRHLPDGRVLLGGGRNLDIAGETTYDLSTTPPIQSALHKLLTEWILPGKSFAIDYSWGGIMGMGREKLPIVRAVSPSIWVAVRMSGMGVALAPQIGTQLAEEMSDYLSP